MTSNYPWNSPYAFAENKVINGIDLEGLEYVLRIFSPEVSRNFLNAVNNKDLYEQRRITAWAKDKNNKISWEGVEWIVKCGGTVMFDANLNPVVAQLDYDENAPKGVTVITQRYENNDPNSGKIIEDKPLHWAPHEDSKYSDMKYPVDVKPEEFYKDNDFIGEYGGWALQPGWGIGNGWMHGYLKGWGFVNYRFTFEGPGLNIARDGGGIQGSYSGTTPLTPLSLSGFGTSTSVGYTFFEAGVWKGYASEDDYKQGKDPVWTGSFGGLAAGANLKIPWAGNTVKTKSTLIFPSPLITK